NEPFPKVHLHRALSWNGVDYLDLSAAAAHAQKWRHGGVEIPIPAAEDELLIMAAHAFFENKFITLHELFYLTFITPQITDWPGVTAKAAHYFWEPAFSQFIAAAAVLAESVGLSLSLPSSVRAVPNLQVRLPYLLPLPQTFAYSWQKMWQGVKAGHWRGLPRQLFTYSLVDGAWMYRKAWRKQRGVQAC
ncbi:MAG: hypothetical protein KC421_30380, partial [Anaerolineales bacterium]|nr:hypothetical protein [Anaerolineales bacterium]